MTMHAMHIIKRPLMTEKSTYQNNELGRYVFEVAVSADKKAVKNAIESLYNVKVEKVNTSIIRARIKRNKFGFIGGKESKRAYVTLKEGQSIELF
jgi:large subunit ribosomal protein L23